MIHELRLQKPRFIKSVGHYRDMPRLSSAEYCVAGRSNVGKSSFISHALGAKHLAQVSKDPGKTRVANFYHVDDAMVWVDLPGYGFAHAAQQERHRWAQLMEDYFSAREGLSGVIWLLDIRHPCLPIDIEAYQWFSSLGLPIFAVLTKCDKVGRSELQKSAAQMRTKFDLAAGFVQYSVTSTDARINFWREFDAWIEMLSHK